MSRPKQSTGGQGLSAVLLLGRDTQKEVLQVTLLSLHSPISLGFEAIQARARNISPVLRVMNPATYVGPVSLCFQLQQIILNYSVEDSARHKYPFSSTKYKNLGNRSMIFKTSSSFN